jgi:hypothetical protein
VSLFKKIKGYILDLIEGEIERELVPLRNYERLRKYVEKKRPFSLYHIEDYQQRPFTDIEPYLEIIVKKSYMLPILFKSTPEKNHYVLLSKDIFLEDHEGSILLQVKYKSYSLIKRSKEEKEELLKKIYKEIIQKKKD